MIDFTTQQLSWMIVGAVTVGGGGYMTMNSKVDDIDKKLAVSINTADNTTKMMDKIEKQLVRIEDKIDGRNRNK
jgi:hypothetical protein